MQHQYDVQHDSAQWRLEELHAVAARERLWRGAAPSSGVRKLLYPLFVRH
ncbi:hypothetical protein [Deinococcus sp. YIM 77859]|nr:hypothetical protein [Deinococcus sp. YIM 77859]